jgi:hypothetical protein
MVVGFHVTRHVLLAVANSQLTLSSPIHLLLRTFTALKPSVFPFFSVLVSILQDIRSAPLIKVNSDAMVSFLPILCHPLT